MAVTDDVQRRRYNADAAARYRARYPGRHNAAVAKSRVKPSSRAKTNARQRTEKWLKYAREYSKTEKGRACALKRHRRALATPHGRLNNRVRAAIRRGFATNYPGRSIFFKTAGYTLEELKIHIERQFCNGMSWENAAMWHVDHIIPLSHFHLKSLDDPNFKIARGLTNLRPMWATDNLAKGSRVVTLL